MEHLKLINLVVLVVFTNRETWEIGIIKIAKSLDLKCFESLTKLWVNFTLKFRGSNFWKVQEIFLFWNLNEHKLQRKISNNNENLIIKFLSHSRFLYIVTFSPHAYYSYKNNGRDCRFNSMFLWKISDFCGWEKLSGFGE